MWAGIHHNLGNDYWERIRGERSTSVEEAIKHNEQALEVRARETSPFDWAMTQNSLGNLYLDRILGEHAENLERAIQHYEKALEVTTRECFPEGWAKTQDNLGVVYRQRIVGERAENLEQAIACHMRALEIRTRAAFPIDWAATQNNLGAVFTERIKGERADNIERAIECYERSLEVRTRETLPFDWAMGQNNLGIAYNMRVRGQRAENVDLAIGHYLMALEVWTRDALPDRWAVAQNNLGNAYRERLRGKRSENQEEAIRCYMLAMEIKTRNADPIDWSMLQHNLGVAFVDRTSGDLVTNIALGIEALKKALEVRTREALPYHWAITQHNLGIAFRKRYQGNQAAEFEQAIACHEKALEVLTVDKFPAESRLASRYLGNIFFDRQQWSEAYQAYSQAIEAGKYLFAAAYTDFGRRTELGNISRLHAQAAYCLLRLDRPADALVLIEQGKTRLLVEVLSLDDAALSILTVDQRETLLAARENVRSLERELEISPNVRGSRNEIEIVELLKQFRLQLNALIDAFRAEHPQFMATKLDLSSILKTIPQDGALIVLLVTSQGGLAFVLPHGINDVTSDHVLTLPTFDEAALSDLLFGSPRGSGWLAAYRDFCARSAIGDWKAFLENATNRLWDILLGPVHQRLMSLGIWSGAHIVLVPDRGSGLLPFHAAWRRLNGTKRAFLDEYRISYTPSVYALSASQRRTIDPVRQPLSLLAVVNPTGDLQYSAVEGEAVVAMFAPGAACLLKENAASKRSVLELLPRHSYLHFACHGFYDWEEVMRSGLVLANKECLDLKEILFGIDLSATRLVTLSACETGLVEFQKSPDEYVGLQAAFLQAGAAGVLGTLWPVDDLATGLLMPRFYQEHIQMGHEPSGALRASQLWLRDATVSELQGYYTSRVRANLCTDEATRADRVLYGISTRVSVTPYSNPYYWAAFTLTGA